MAPQSDWELIVACREGEASAWESLVERYERLVYSIALSYGVSRDDAADVSQMAFLSLFRSLDALSDDSRLSAWLATVAHRQTKRILLRHRREYPDSQSMIDERLPSVDPASETPMERWEVVEWLQHGMSSLSERCRQMLMALYFDQEEPSYAEVATRLGMPLGSVGPNHARCMERLKQLLEGRT
jgi:RNA polymerase sigma factor (sigma-70 family)